MLFANPEDIEQLGMSPGMHVDVTSHFRGYTRSLSGFRLVAYELPRGCMAAYYPEINSLVPLAHVARGSNTPAYKSVVISLKPSAR